MKQVSNFYALPVNKNYSLLNDIQNLDVLLYVSFGVKGNSK